MNIFTKLVKRSFFKTISLILLSCVVIFSYQNCSNSSLSVQADLNSIVQNSETTELSKTSSTCNSDSVNIDGVCFKKDSAANTGCSSGQVSIMGFCFSKIVNPVTPGSAGGATGVRTFYMTLEASLQKADVDLPMWYENQPQLAGDSIMMLTSWNSDSFATTFAEQVKTYGYDFNRIKAVNIDEPFWWTLTPTGVTTNPCYTTSTDSRLSQIKTVLNRLKAAAAVIKSYSPNTRIWVNYSLSEVQWQQDSSCPLALNDTSIDVISLDYYGVDFNTTVKPYYDWLYSHRPKSSQQLALLPGTYFVEGIDDPNTQASYIQGFFDYADQMNYGKCTMPNSVSDFMHQNCPVWLVAGWMGGSTNFWKPSGSVYRGELDPKSGALQAVWRAELQKPILAPISGQVTSVSRGLIKGWAVDSDNTSLTYVDTYIDGVYQGTAFATDTGGAQFSHQVSKIFFDGKPHLVQISAIAPTNETWNYVLIFNKSIILGRP